MSIWQIAVLFALAGCAIGCLLAVYKAIEKLARNISLISSELTKMNSKLTAIEAVNRDSPKETFEQPEPDLSLEAIEAAISNFEKLKRIDITK